MENPRGAPLDVRHRLRTRGGWRGEEPMGGASMPARRPPDVNVQILPPSIYKPPRGTDFILNGNAAALTAANTPQELGGSFPFTLPSGSVGVVRSLVLQVNQLLATSDLRWRLKINSSPVSGWNDLTVFPRAAASFSLAYGPEETFIEVPEAARLSLEVEVLDAGTYTMGASLHGWYYNQAYEETFAQAWNA